MAKIRVGIYSTITAPAKRLAIVELDVDESQLVRGDMAWKDQAREAAERLGLHVQSINHVRKAHDGADIHVAVVGVPYGMGQTVKPRAPKPPATRGGKPVGTVTTEPTMATVRRQQRGGRA